MYDRLCIAREHELSRLNMFLDQAIAGQGQVCFVTGEAGSGKSTLVHEFSRRAELAHPELITTIGICNAQSGLGDPYLPFREVLALLTGDVDKKLAEGVISAENATRLRKFLIRSVQTVIDVGPDLIDVLVPGGGLLVKFGTAVADRAGWLEKLEKAAKKKHGLPGLGELTMEQSHVFEQFAKVLTSLANEKPLLLLLDDLHWADASSINLLFHLGRSIANSRILIAGSYRPEEIARGRAGSRHPLEDVVNELRRYAGEIRIPLDERSEPARRQFVDALLDSHPNSFDASFRQVLFQHTGGQPLFTVELLRELAAQGAIKRSAEGCWQVAAHLDWETLPARVEGVIEQRIGRLEVELQDILTAASVEGARFTAEVIARVQSQDARHLVGRLSGELDKRDHLIQAQGVRRLGQQRLSLYQFMQNLYQVYLYESLDEIQRTYLHENVGLTLEELYGAQAAEIAGQLAHHFEQAGWIQKAVQYRLEAANQAIWSSAYKEASEHLHAGLALLNQQPDLPESPHFELQLQAALAPTLVALQGWGKPGAQQAYDRACLLSERLGNHEYISSLLHGLATLHEFRGEFDRSEELMKQRLEMLPPSDQDPQNTLETYELLSCSTFHRGSFNESLQHVNQGLHLSDLTALPAPASQFHGEDPAISCLTWRALNLWFLGQPDQALVHMQQALDLIQQPVTIFTKATVLCRAALLHLLRGELEQVSQLTGQANAITSEMRYPYFWSSSLIIGGYASLVAQSDEKGITAMRQGLAIHERAGAHMDRPFYLALLADALRLTGQYEQALQALQPAIQQIQQGRTFFYEAELYRLQGQILQEQDAHAYAAAESSYRQALHTAERQGARSLQLRAALSLASLYQAGPDQDQVQQNQARATDAKNQLAQIYATFSEGFTTADLARAQSLLQPAP